MGFGKLVGKISGENFMKVREFEVRVCMYFNGGRLIFCNVVFGFLFLFCLFMIVFD